MKYLDYEGAWGASWTLHYTSLYTSLIRLFAAAKYETPLRPDTASLFQATIALVVHSQMALSSGF